MPWHWPIVSFRALKQLLLICAVVGCGGKSGPANIADPILEKAIREQLKHIGEAPTGKLTKADLEKVPTIGISDQLTSVKGLEKLTKLRLLSLSNNPDLTKAQIDQLQKALPNCFIHSNPTK